MSNKNDHDIYIIPPNFIETGTFFGGMFRARNVIEAGILALAIGTPVFLCLPFGLAARIIDPCDLPQLADASGPAVAGDLQACARPQPAFELIQIFNHAAPSSFFRGWAA